MGLEKAPFPCSTRQLTPDPDRFQDQQKRRKGSQRWAEGPAKCELLRGREASKTVNNNNQDAFPTRKHCRTRSSCQGCHRNCPGSPCVILRLRSVLEVWQRNPTSVLSGSNAMSTQSAHIQYSALGMYCVMKLQIQLEARASSSQLRQPSRLSSKSDGGVLVDMVHARQRR